MTKTNYVTKFLRHLETQQVSLVDRFHMALGALMSQNFPLPNKEQIIVDWIARSLQENQPQCDVILKLIEKTLACDWLLAFSDPINGTNLIEAFVQLKLIDKGKHNKSIAVCLLLLLENPGFQRFCRFEIQPMCEATVAICDIMNSLSSTGGSAKDSISKGGDLVSAGLERLFESIHNVYKVTQQRNEFKLYFVKSILPALLKLKYNFKDSTTFQNLFEELVIGEDFALVCEAFKSETKRKIHTHLKALVNLMIQNEETCDIVLLSSLLFDVYVQSCGRNSKYEPNYLPMFYILTSVAGFPVPLPYKTVVSHIAVGTQRLLVLNELLHVLQKHNIPVSSESDEGVLSTNLELIEREILSENWPVSAELLQTLKVMFSVYPESIRLLFSEFAYRIIFVEKCSSKIVKCYNNLLINVVKSFSDLNQLDKFFALFFHKCVLAWKDSRLSSLTADMVLTKEFFASLSDKLPSLTGNHLKTIIGRMEKTFSKELVSAYENTHSADMNLRLFTEIIVQVMCHVLENAHIVMPTRWNILSGEIKTLVSTIQRFGLAVLRLKEANLSLLGFLQLVRVIVDMQLALNYYTVSLATEDIVPCIKTKKTSHGVYNLSNSHGFLTASDWKQISQMVEESHNSQLVHAWFNLLKQKFVRLGDMVVVTYLTTNADGVWLWSSLISLAGSVPLDHLEMYTDRLLAPDTLSAGNFLDKLTALENIDIFTNRPLRAALNLQVLRHVSEALTDNSVLSRKMAKLLDIHSVLKYEAELIQSETPPEINMMTEGLAEIINKCLWDNTPRSLNQAEKDYTTKLVF